MSAANAHLKNCSFSSASFSRWPLLVFFLGLEACDPVEIDDEQMPPQLFLDESPCPTSDPNVAPHLAKMSENLAQSQARQFPFSPAAGVATVNRLLESIACFRVATDELSVTRVESKLHDMQREVTASFLSHRFTLKWSFDVGDFRTAIAEIQALRSFFSPEMPSDPKARAYVRWLDAKELSLRDVESTGP